MTENSERKNEQERSSEMHVFGGESIAVFFRKTGPIDAPESRYPGFRPGTMVLGKGTTKDPGRLPLPCDIVLERDVAVTLRDGTVIYIDTFRPSGGTDLPAIVAWSSYGKEEPAHCLDDIPGRAGVPKDAVSGFQTWEGPDPAYWCNHGYAVINVDARGAFNSQGDIYFWGSTDARDGYDVIEWLAAQKWCNGKVTMSGNSWLAIAQWFMAAGRPPHLAAIAPWEGLCDVYRHDVLRGGVPSPGFNEMGVRGMRGNNRVEDVPAMVPSHPFFDVYWQDKAAKLEDIEVPAYVVASWTSIIHSAGAFEGFRRISSRDKWLRVHNRHEWPDYYDSRYMEDLRRFFDRYLKGIENGWEKTPRVRLSVLDPGGSEIVDRPEAEWPLARTEHRKFYLDVSSGTLSPAPSAGESTVRYKADDGGLATFTITFDRETELTGYATVRLWIEAVGADDADLWVLIEKLDEEGRVLVPMARDEPAPTPMGVLRASHRAIDPARSTPSEPYPTHRSEELLNPEEVVRVDIPLWPMGTIWHKGQQLRLVVAGHNLVPIPGFPPALTKNRGDHVIHAGGKYDSYLLMPVIPD